MAVREATPGDVAEVTAMVLEHAEHENSSHLCHFTEQRGADALFGPQPTLRCLIAFPEESPEVTAGFTLWYPTFSSWAGTSGIWVEDIYVRPQHRKKGFGREMLDRLREMTSGRVEWDVHIENRSAREFYLRLGAEPVTEWEKFRWTR